MFLHRYLYKQNFKQVQVPQQREFKTVSVWKLLRLLLYLFNIFLHSCLHITASLQFIIIFVLQSSCINMIVIGKYAILPVVQLQTHRSDPLIT